MGSGQQQKFGMTEETQDEKIQRRLSTFTWENPLGLSLYVHYTLAVYAPALVVFGSAMNMFAAWVLQSSFLRDLIVQPLLTLLLRLNTLLLVCGPLYIWLVQTFSIYIKGEQIFHCFLLNLTHNFSLISTALVLVTILIERGLAIGTPKASWNTRRNLCTNLGTIIVQASVLLALVELYCLDVKSVTSDLRYPVCIPWWENEHGSTVIFKMLAIVYSLGPAVLIIVFILVLELCAAKFSILKRVEQDSLPDYQGLLLELTSAVHLKFVNSASTLGIVFIILCSPVGLFIVLGPALHAKASGAMVAQRNFQINNSDILAVRASSILTANVSSDGLPNRTDSDFDDGANVVATPTAAAATASLDTIEKSILSEADSLLGLLEYKYALVSRGDAETVIWLMRYSFCLLVVPILLVTEVLFKREWRGRVRQVMDIIRLRQRRSGPGDVNQATVPGAPWKNSPVAGSPERNKMAGPYIARMNTPDSGVMHDGEGRGGGRDRRVIRPENSSKDIEVFDASKPSRAGRKIVGLGNRTRRKETKPPTADDDETIPNRQSPFFRTVGKAVTGVFKAKKRSTDVDLTDESRSRRASLRISTDVDPRSESSSSWVAEPPRERAMPNGTEASAAPKRVAAAAMPAEAAAPAPETPATAYIRGKVADVPGTVERGKLEAPPTPQNWDYQLIAQLAAVDVRRRGFLSANDASTVLPWANEEGSPSGGGAPQVAIRTPRKQERNAARDAQSTSTGQARTGRTPTPDKAGGK